MEAYNAIINGVLLFIGILGSVLLGFLMGWKAARPEETIIKPKPFNPGPRDEDDQDIFSDALEVKGES